MPARIEISTEKLAKIVELRGQSMSWVKIAKETTIPRQIAKRAYIERNLTMSREELKKAREVVAAEELRWHINCLDKVAQSLLDILEFPSYEDKRQASDVINYLFQHDILRESDDYILRKAQTIKRIGYQNKMLFNSLRAHTREKVKWSLLDDWKHAWDLLIEGRDKLRDMTAVILHNIITLDKGLKERIIESSPNKNVIETISDGIIYILWQIILDGEIEKALFTQNPQSEISYLADLIVANIKNNSINSEQGNLTEIRFSVNYSTKSIIIDDKILADKIINIIPKSINNIFTTNENLIISLSKQAVVMKRAIDNLEQGLDPVVLRPMILNSPKCELCPA